MKITNEALITMAAEEAAFPSADDALDRMCFLTGPLFSSMEAGKRITGEIAAEVIETNFGLKIPREVAEALIIRQAKHGYVAQEAAGDAKVYFSNGQKDREKGRSAVDALIKDFRLFVKDKSLLPKISDEEILDLFLVEVFKVSDLLNADDFTEKFPKIEKWKPAVVSEYVIAHTAEDGSLPPLLSKLAELCLMRSLVDSMTGQRRKLQRSNLVAILDAPLALFSVGASGSLNKSGIESTLSLAKKFGVRVAVLPVSIDEMKRVLHCLTSAPMGQIRAI